MPQVTWIAKVDGADHKIQLEHQILGGKRRLLVDGWEVHKGRSLVDIGEDVRFAVAGRWALVRIMPRGLGYAYRIAVDELWLDDWTLVVRRPALVAVGGLALLAHALGILLLAPAGARDPASFFELAVPRALLVVFVAMQLLGGSRWAWFVGLGYAFATVAYALMAATSGPLAAALLPDMRTSIGVAIDVLTCDIAIAALVARSTRAFYAPAQKAEPAPA